MSSTPEELFSCGLVHAENAKSESEMRCAISFLYYSAYHACYKFHDSLLRPGSVGQSNGVHAQLISQLQQPTIPKSDPNYELSRVLSKSLRIAMSHRIIANYRLHITIHEGDLKETLDHCRTISKQALLRE